MELCWSAAVGTLSWIHRSAHCHVTHLRRFVVPNLHGSSAWLTESTGDTTKFRNDCAVVLMRGSRCRPNFVLQVPLDQTVDLPLGPDFQQKR